jgi:hypothetical protein
MKTFTPSLLTLFLALTLTSAVAADPPLLLEDESFQDQMRSLGAQRNDPDRLRHAQKIIAAHRISSLQVKAVCLRLADDNARLEFATAAYPRTIDPENFYEVYDAFTSFSKVMRLHDRVREFPRHRPGPVVIAPPPPPLTTTDEDMKSILQALRRESFDNVRIQLARQIISSSQKKFLSDHVRQMMQTFDFEPSRLEIAKFAYDYTFDREKYFLVNEAFDFSNSKDTLSRYIQQKNK